MDQALIPISTIQKFPALEGLTKESSTYLSNLKVLTSGSVSNNLSPQK